VTYRVAQRRDHGVSIEEDFVNDLASDGWELAAVVALPVTFDRLENDWLRYFFKKSTP
jgi:hypothetical protein